MWDKSSVAVPNPHSHSNPNPNRNHKSQQKPSTTDEGAAKRRVQFKQ